MRLVCTFPGCGRCRRANLRAATSSQNRCNTGNRSDTSSGVKGVSWCRRIGKWHAQIGHNHRVIFLGYFNGKQDAAEAVTAARVRLHGDFARAA